MASHTPNLDLLKKDPITDGSQTFNIETMLNENWDKIDSAVGQVREELADIDIPLSDATNGNRSDVAASERAVGEVMSAAQAAQTTANAANMAAAAAQTRADSAFQLGNERKAEVVAALVAKGISASTSESWESLISKMAGVIKATGNAIAADVLSGKTFSNASGNNLTGSMPDRGAGGTITPGTTNQTKAAGYYSSAITVLGDADLVPGNIKDGVNIFNVVGKLKPLVLNESNVNMALGDITPAAGSTEILDFFTIPPDSTRTEFIVDGIDGNSNYIQNNGSYGRYRVNLVDETGNRIVVLDGNSNPSYNAVANISINHTSRTVKYTTRDRSTTSVSIPAAFNFNRSITFRIEIYSNSSTSTSIVTCKLKFRILNL